MKEVREKLNKAMEEAETKYSASANEIIKAKEDKLENIKNIKHALKTEDDNLQDISTNFESSSTRFSNKMDSKLK